MKFIAILLTLINLTLAKNILLTNDDGWTATNIRATYRDLKKAGYNVILVAPASQRSGWGGRFVVPSGKKLESDGEFGYVKKGDPAWGHEDHDKGIWYFNGTPASCVAFGLKYVIPKYFNNASIDLVVSGPNEGKNMAAMYTISGTIGATYNAVYRGLPGVAFSGSNGNNSFFKDSLNNDTKAPANIYAKKVVELVDQLFKAQGSNSTRVLPKSVGLNVNLPPVGTDQPNCTDPAYVFSRMTGDLTTGSDLYYDESSGKVKSTDSHWSALELCDNGICDLPSENSVLANGACKASIAVFSVDYDANKKLTSKVNDSLKALFSH